MVPPADAGRVSKRNDAAILIVVFCCLLSSARMAVKSPSLARLTPDDIAQRSDQRFAALKSSLPERGVLGYIGEPGDAGLADYYLTQYALAPLVLDRSTNHSLVIGNFSAQNPASPPGLHVVRDFGDGVLLFSNKEAR